METLLKPFITAPCNFILYICLETQMRVSLGKNEQYQLQQIGIASPKQAWSYIRTICFFTCVHIESCRAAPLWTPEQPELQAFPKNMRAALWDEPKSRGGDGRRRKTAVCCIVHPLLKLLFWASNFFFFFFFVILSVLGKRNVYHVYVELIELICLPSMFTVNCVLASLENVQRRRESQQSCRHVERSVRDGQENFQIKAGRVLALGASRKQLSHCGKSRTSSSFLIPPSHQERPSNLFILFIFIWAALLLKLASVVMPLYGCSDMASSQKHTDIMLWGMCHCLCVQHALKQ